MGKQLPENLSFCKYARTWIITETPKKCSNYYDCASCEHHEVRKLNKYITRKLRRLEKENDVQTIL